MIDYTHNSKEEDDAGLDRLHAAQITNQRMIEGLSLLGIAKCPNSNCDNNGTIAYENANGDLEIERCEWCHRKKELLNL